MGVQSILYLHLILSFQISHPLACKTTLHCPQPRPRKRVASYLEKILTSELGVISLTVLTESHKLVVAERRLDVYWTDIVGVGYFAGLEFNLNLRILIRGYLLLALRGPPQTPPQNQVEPPPQPEGTCPSLPPTKRTGFQLRLTHPIRLNLTDLSQSGLNPACEHHFIQKKPPRHHSWV